MLQCSSKNTTPNGLHPFPFDCTYIHSFRKKKILLKKDFRFILGGPVHSQSDSFNQKGLKTGLERQFGLQSLAVRT